LILTYKTFFELDCLRWRRAKRHWRSAKTKKAIIDRCIIDRLNASSKFDVASSMCEDELLFLAKDCLTNSSSYEYCKDQRFIGYLTQHNITLNSTVSSYSNLTGNSLASNSTYP